MSGAWLVALLLQNAPAPPAPPAPTVPLTLSPARPRVGDRVVVSAALPAAAGERLRFARPPEVDAAFARVEPFLADATDRGAASLRVEMVAAAAGTFRVGPFRLSGASGGAIETGTLDVEIAPGWRDGAAPGFDEWRGPLAPPAPPAPHRWLALLAAAGALVLAAAWIALRRRSRRAPPAIAAADAAPTWRDELSRLAAHIPESLSARRLWWGDFARVLRGELARQWRNDSLDCTTEELSARAPALATPGVRDELIALLRTADDGKFARASAGVAAASSAVTAALARLEELETARAPVRTVPS